MTIKVENRVGVQAPAEVIWNLVADIPGWRDWNPLHTAAEGEVRIGARLLTTEVLPGKPERPTSLFVIEWVPLEQLHLRNESMRGWVKSIRYIEIEELGPASCIVSTGELFADGMLTRLHLRSHRRALRHGFTAHGEALKAHAETRWAAQQG
ncbi:MAG TPA: SRPBCC domain-containing protein [Phenylobacterium sp.]